jgi:hypothetical protein
MSLDSQLIVIESINREPTSFSSTWFKVRFPGRTWNFQAVTLKNFMMAATIPNVAAGVNDQITVRDPNTSTNYIATLAPGNYDLTTFIGAAQTALNNVWANSFTVNVDSTTQRITVTGNNAFILNWSNSTRSAAYVMGFIDGVDTASGISITAPNAYDLSGPMFLYLDLSFAGKKVVNSAGYSSSFVIPMDANSGAFTILSESSTFVTTSLAESYQTADMVEVKMHVQYPNRKYVLADNGGANIGIVLELQSLR